MTNDERDRRIIEIHESLREHLARGEASEERVKKLDKAVFGDGRGGLSARVLVLEGGLGLVAIFGAIALTWLFEKL